jgi:serine/threonine protein kinase
LLQEYIINMESIIAVKNKTFIVMELMSGTVREMVGSDRCLTVDTAQLLAYQMLLALEYLHSMNIIHRDLKPANILAAECSGIVWAKFKLADFGLSKIISHSQAAALTQCGTSVYMAPEIEYLDRQEGYTSKVDIWSLGSTLYFW